MYFLNISPTDWRHCLVFRNIKAQKCRMLLRRFDELVPVCPEDELFGTPRSTIRLRAVDGEIKAFAGKKEIYSQLQEKSQEIASRYRNVVGFIGISRSPTCGLSAGVKDLGRTIKAPMHQSLDCPTTEISYMNTEGNRQIFLERVRKYESR